MNESDQDRWHRHFLRLSQLHASMSKDPSTKVGSVIVGPDREIRSAGFNGFSRGIVDTDARLNDRDFKNKYIIHAEENAIIAAARVGVPLKGCTLYVTAIDVETGAIWGGPPCGKCLARIDQAGIVRVISTPPFSVPDRWKESLKDSMDFIRESGICYAEVSID